MILKMGQKSFKPICKTLFHYGKLFVSPLETIRFTPRNKQFQGLKHILKLFGLYFSLIRRPFFPGSFSMHAYQTGNFGA